MTAEELKNKCKERARIFQQAMESCKSSSPMDCIEWFADRIAELEEKLEQAEKDLADYQFNYPTIKEVQKENTGLKGQISFLEDNLRVARKDRENLQLDVAKGLKEFVKDYPATSLRYLANEKYVEQLTKAKEFLKWFVWYFREGSPNLVPYKHKVAETEQFLKEVSDK